MMDIDRVLGNLISRKKPLLNRDIILSKSFPRAHFGDNVMCKILKIQGPRYDFWSKNATGSSGKSSGSSAKSSSSSSVGKSLSKSSFSNIATGAN